MDTVSRGQSGQARIGTRPGTTIGRAPPTVHFGILDPIPAESESGSLAGRSSSSDTDVGSESDGSHGEHGDWDLQIAAAVASPNSVHDFGFITGSPQGRPGSPPPRTPAARSHAFATP